MTLMVGLGEVLWDIFPDGTKLLGGAPANFAFHAHQLGHDGVVVSRIGRDELGQALLQELRGRGPRTDAVQIDDVRPTGTVHVKVADDGTHDFLITPNVAWDHLVATRALVELCEAADVLCFGTLAQREASNRSTIELLLTRACGVKVFDINLRQDCWSREVIEAGLGHCQVVKFNDDELRVLQDLALVPPADDILTWGRSLLSKYGIELLALTRGAAGAMLIAPTEWIDEPGIEVDVADSVGAGDAFTAGLVEGFIGRWPLHLLAKFANRLGAYVASQPGATPTVPEEYRRYQV